MENKLAIIIPAYKIEFLEACLNSIARQSNMEFKVYIGNDFSPDNIDSVVSKFSQRLDIDYKKFQENLGQQSLVKHWQRCIEMTANEDWIWLFSDDDTMDPDCVATFFEIQKEHKDCDIFRFNLQVIDESDKVLRTTIYPRSEYAAGFLINRFLLHYDSAITNYVFSRRAFDQFGFNDFPMAWCSDDASIVNFSNNKPIITVDHSFVQWRISTSNISATGNVAIQRQKVYARLEYVRWLYSSKKIPALKREANKKIILNWIMGSINGEFKGFTSQEKETLLRQVEDIIGINVWFFKKKKTAMYFKNRVNAKLSSIFKK